MEPASVDPEEQPLDPEAEAEALGKIVLGFRSYKRTAELEVARWEHNFSHLPLHHQALLAPRQLLKFATARQCVQVNAFFIASMLASFAEDNQEAPPHLAGANRAADDVAKAEHRSTYEDYSKVTYVLKNLARDWSAEGAAERQACYGPILAELRSLFGDWTQGPPTPGATPPCVLLPGCGLARLCCEVAGLGLQAQGNEFSYHMLLTASFILNQVHEACQYTVFPWMHSNCNQLSDAEQLRAVAIPDTAPADMVAAPGLLSMCAGDFTEVYSRPSWQNHFDCVVTSFFIDTAHNVVEYMEVINHCLKEGGYWINLGPLLYHWAEASRGDELSIELSLEDVVAAAQQLGFKVLKQATVQTPYTANIRSMYQTSYNAAMWTMVKQKSAAGGPLVGASAAGAPGASQGQEQEAGLGLGGQAQHAMQQLQLQQQPVMQPPPPPPR